MHFPRPHGARETKELQVEISLPQRWPPTCIASVPPARRQGDMLCLLAPPVWLLPRAPDQTGMVLRAGKLPLRTRRSLPPGETYQRKDVCSEHTPVSSLSEEEGEVSEGGEAPLSVRMRSNPSAVVDSGHPVPSVPPRTSSVQHAKALSSSQYWAQALTDQDPTSKVDSAKGPVRSR